MTEQCVLLRAGAAAEGRTGMTYAPGVSAATAGAICLCLQLASLPPRARSRAHRHDHHESAAYVIEGTMVVWFGEQLQHTLAGLPGDFIYIPCGVPHLVLNGSDTKPAVAVLARNDGREQEDVTELPELDALPHLKPGPAR
jgi:uncharacterized RmlC-like cupin family protein